MLRQGLIKIGSTTAFIDGYSDLCVDGNPCDSSGDVVYQIDGELVRERDFKEYRKFSPQFRNELIMDNIRKSGKNLTSVSCSCSKCGTAAMDEVFWM